MKKLLIVVCLLTLTACEKSTTPRDIKAYNTPPELSDCKMYVLSNGLNNIVVVRCPNSCTSTTYKEGKTDKTTIVIDGVTYTKENQ